MRQHHAARLGAPMRETFEALVGVLAKGRWAAEYLFDPDAPLPKAGLRYEQQRPTVLRRGRVVECLPPVSITLVETLLDAPCRVRLRLRWRLEPVDVASLVLLDARFDLKGAAALRRGHWNERIRGHCTRMLRAVEAAVTAGAGQRGASGTSGHSQGRMSMTVAKITAASGKPTLK